MIALSQAFSITICICNVTDDIMIALPQAFSISICICNITDDIMIALSQAFSITICIGNVTDDIMVALSQTISILFVIIVTCFPNMYKVVTNQNRREFFHHQVARLRKQNIISWSVEDMINTWCFPSCCPCLTRHVISLEMMLSLPHTACHGMSYHWECACHFNLSL